MDQWLLAVTSDPAAKGSAKDLEVAGAGPVHCRFSIPPSFLTMCSSERCLSTMLLETRGMCGQDNITWLASYQPRWVWSVGVCEQNQSSVHTARL